MTVESGSKSVFAKWKARFQELLKENAHASESWETLTEAGVDPKFLSGFLAFSCDCEENLASKLIELLRSWAIEDIQTCLKLAGRLEQDRKDLESFKSDLPEALLEKMDEAARQLRTSVSEVREFVTRHKLNTNFFLAWLLDSVKEATGTPKYREVSILLECAYAAFGQPMPFIGEKALRKTYTRYKKENPYAGLLTADGKRNLLWGVLILAVLLVITSDTFVESLSTRQAVDQKDDNSLLPDKFGLSSWPRIRPDKSVPPED